MKKQKRFLVISFLSLIFSVQLFAQTDSTQIDLKGKWALQFQITQNFTLSDFQGGVISGKYHFNNHSAIRFGVASFISSYNTETKYLDPDTTYYNNRDYNISSIYIQYLYYTEIKNSITMFFGVGGNYGKNNTDYESDNYSIISTSNYNYGFEILIGTEWFVRSNIGLSAEYSYGFSYSKNDADKTSPDGTLNGIIKNSQTSYSDNSVKFGVSIYF